MWTWTNERLLEKAIDAEMRADEAFVLRAAGLLARINNPKRKKRSAVTERPADAASRTFCAGKFV